jgi:hypothetical protein
MELVRPGPLQERPSQALPVRSTYHQQWLTVCCEYSGIFRPLKQIDLLNKLSIMGM